MEREQKETKAMTDLPMALGTIAASLVVAGRLVLPWLERRGVIRANNRAEANAIETLDAALAAQTALTNEQQKIAEGWHKQAEAYRVERIKLEQRLDQAYEAQRIERETTYQTFRREKQADREQIEKLSMEVHDLTMKVANLTQENVNLQMKIAILSKQIGDDYASKTA